MLKLSEQTLLVIQAPPGLLTFYSAAELDNIRMGSARPKLNVHRVDFYI